MRYLLDTHALLWMADDDPRLSNEAKKILIDPTAQRYISITSIWEIAIKVGLGKFVLSMGFREYLNRTIVGYDLKVIHITLNECVTYRELHFPSSNHRDPYDRMIVVHAISHH